jgi:aminoglycoside phosphotransferase (APT) family kinase protein
VRWLGEGYDSTAFAVDDRWVFRFPKRSDVEQQLLLEIRVLPQLARESPVAVPDFCFAGVPSDLFPRHFGGYPLIPGAPANGDIALDGRVDRVAPILGRFLSWLHAFNTADAIHVGVRERDATELLCEMQADAIADFDNLKAVSPDAPLRRWRTFLDETSAPSVAAATPAPAAPTPAKPAPPTSAPAAPARSVLVHGDLAAEHVLYDVASDRVTGIIDWSEIAISDAAVDFAALYHAGGEPFAMAVLEHYDGDSGEAVLSRARYMAACRGVMDVTFGLERSRPEYIAGGLRALSLCVPDSARS